MGGFEDMVLKPVIYVKTITKGGGSDLALARITADLVGTAGRETELHVQYGHHLAFKGSRYSPECIIEQWPVVAR